MSIPNEHAPVIHANTTPEDLVDDAKAPSQSSLEALAEIEAGNTITFHTLDELMDYIRETG